MGIYGLDLLGAADRMAAERHGDWYRDPWGWPDLSRENIESNLSEIESTILNQTPEGIHLNREPHFHLVDVPKSWLGIRPAVTQDYLSKLAYTAAVEIVAPKAQEKLPEWVYGWRMRDGIHSPSSAEWELYANSWPNIATQDYGLQTDITSHFASLQASHISDQVATLIGKTAASGTIDDVVASHNRRSGRSGLPQRCFASAILANTLMQPIDDTLSASLTKGNTSAVRRWMDDISAEGEQGALYELVLDLQKSARSIGLELNMSKTHLTLASTSAARFENETRREIWAPLMRYVNRYTGDEFTTTDVDLRNVYTAEQIVLENPYMASKSNTSTVLKALGKHREFNRAPEWMGVAHLLPHSADALADYLQMHKRANSASSPAIVAWFQSIVGSKWGSLDWVVSHYARIFDPSETEQIRSVLEDWLANSHSLHKIAIASWLLSQAYPQSCRSLVLERTDRVDDPQVQRIFALALASSFADRPRVEALARRDPRNQLLASYLASKNWRI